jgi:nucleoside-diphosphate-sugar epimerase
LVVGSSGFIGSHLCERLAESGHRVHGFDLRSPDDDNGVELTTLGDVRRVDQLRPALAGVDTVIQLAAVHFDFGHAPEEYFSTNEGGMRSLLQAMTEQRVRRLIYVSSIAVYGDHEGWADERTPPAPETPYGESKLAAERLVERWVEDDPARSALVLRPCAVYGERNVSNMMNLIRQIHSGYFVMFGSGENIKATAYVGNLVDATLLLFDRLAPGLQTLNYADKPDLTALEVVMIIRQALGKPARPLQLPLRLGLLAALPFELVKRLSGRDLPVSTTRLRKLNRPTQVKADAIRQLGFRQRVSSKEGLERMVAHFLAQRQAAVEGASIVSPPSSAGSLSPRSDVTQNSSQKCDPASGSICTVRTRR